MRSPVKSGSRNGRDAEAELNLPPGFRFHPTDEELVLHYLCRKVAVHLHHNVAGGRAAPPPIIAEVDLYKHDPWELPELALFGTKEWYFFTPRDRKYPNGSRPNRAAGSGHWKATGADKPVRPKATPGETVGIKKALVFYAGKAPNGIKTNWIMHEYRLALPKTKHNINGAPPTSRLDDWVLCRLYNKKNINEKIVIEGQDRRHLSPLEDKHHRDNSDHSQNSFNSFEESDAEITYTPPKGQVYVDYNRHDVGDELEFMLRSFEAVGPGPGIIDDLDTMKRNGGNDLIDVKMEDEDKNENENDWFTSLSLEDLQYSLDEMTFPSGDQICGINYEMPIMF